MSEAPAKSKKPIVLIVAVLLILAALFAVKMYFESKIVKQAKEDLTLLEPHVTAEAASVSASLLSRSVTYNDITVKLQDFDEGYLKIDSITQSGIDWNTLMGNPGDVSTYSSAVIKNMQFMAGAMTMATIPNYEIKGVTVPYRDLKSAILKLKGDSPSEEDILAVMPNLTKIKMDSVKANDISINFMIGTASIGSIESSDYVFGQSYGPASVNNVKVQMMGEELASLEKVGCDGIVFPAIVAQLFEKPHETIGFLNSAAVDKDPLNVFTPLEINNLHLKKLRVGGPSPMAVDELYGDLRLYRDKRSGLKYGFKGLEVNKKMLKSSPALRLVGAMLKEPLMLNFDVEGFINPADMTELGGNLHFSDAKLGAVNMNVEMAGPKNLLVDMDASIAEKDILLKSFEFNIEGKGMVDMLIALGAGIDGTSNYQAAYDEIMESIDSSLMHAEPFQAEVLNAIKNLVENGGSLALSLKPDKPFRLDQIDSGEDFDAKKYGASVKYLPPKK